MVSLANESHVHFQATPPTTYSSPGLLQHVLLALRGSLSMDQLRFSSEFILFNWWCAYKRPRSWLSSCLAFPASSWVRTQSMSSQVRPVSSSVLSILVISASDTFGTFLKEGWPSTAAEAFRPSGHCSALHKNTILTWWHPTSRGCAAYSWHFSEKRILSPAED